MAELPMIPVVDWPCPPPCPWCYQATGQMRTMAPPVDGMVMAEPGTNHQLRVMVCSHDARHMLAWKPFKERRYACERCGHQGANREYVHGAPPDLPDSIPADLDCEVTKDGRLVQRLKDGRRVDMGIESTPP